MEKITTPDSVFKQDVIEKVNTLINDSNESYREYNLEHDDSMYREFCEGFSYGESIPDWMEVKDILEKGLFDSLCNLFDQGSFEALTQIVDNAPDKIKENIVNAIIEAAEISVDGMYNPSGAILNSVIVGELENELPDEATALINTWGLVESDLSIEYYINKELSHCYIDCSYDVFRLILNDTEAVIEIMQKEISDSL